MSTQRLDNDRWGFESNCFVCEPRNGSGLQVPFFHDTDLERVYAEFTLDERFSGAPSYVHGGVTLALLDEAAAWAAIAIGGRFAVTHHSATTFERPVRLGVAYRVDAELVDQTDERITAEARVVDGTGKLRAHTRAELAVLGPAHVRDALGVDPTGPDADYLR